MVANIYQKLIEERTKSKLTDPAGFEEEALVQLMTLAFRNNDTLPSHFRIENVLMTLKSIEIMFKKLEIEAEITPAIYNSSGRNFNAFNVTLLQ